MLNKNENLKLMSNIINNTNFSKKFKNTKLSNYKLQSLNLALFTVIVRGFNNNGINVILSKDNDTYYDCLYTTNININDINNVRKKIN